MIRLFIVHWIYANRYSLLAHTLTHLFSIYSISSEYQQLALLHVNNVICNIALSVLRYNKPDKKMIVHFCERSECRQTYRYVHSMFEL